jgi:hypothetical protein
VRAPHLASGGERIAQNGLVRFSLDLFSLILAGEVHDDIMANPPSSEEYPLQRQAD